MGNADCINKIYAGNKKMQIKIPVFTVKAVNTGIFFLQIQGIFYAIGNSARIPYCIKSPACEITLL